MLHIPQSSSITRTSPSDCLTALPGHLLRGVLPLHRGAVGVFYSPRQLGKWKCINKFYIWFEFFLSGKIRFKKFFRLKYWFFFNVLQSSFLKNVHLLGYRNSLIYIMAYFPTDTNGWHFQSKQVFTPLHLLYQIEQSLVSSLIKLNLS